MRLIFDDTNSRAPISQQSQHVTYLKLRNVFGGAGSPTTMRGTPIGATPHDQPAPQSQSLSTQATTAAEHLESVELYVPGQPASGQLSDPWSDDASYLNTGPQRTSMGPPESSSGKVRAWLCGISSFDPEVLTDDQAGNSDVDHDNLVSDHHAPDKFEDVYTKGSEEKISQHATDHPLQNYVTSLRGGLDSREVHAQVANQTACRSDLELKHAPSSELMATGVARPCTPLNYMAMDCERLNLSPLSSNVCTERGPSRYHANRKTLAASPTPTKRLPIFWQQQRQLKENARMEGDTCITSDMSNPERRSGCSITMSVSEQRS